jgi:putative ABC transport system permease protein
MDVRYAIRTLLKKPGFTLAAVLTIALGIGANAAIFTVFDAALLRPLPYKEPERLVHFWEVNRSEDFAEREASYPDYLDYRDQCKSFEEVAGYGFAAFNLTGRDTPERVEGARVTSNFFNALGVTPALGRTFREGEDKTGGSPIAVLSYGLWQRRFGADPNIIDQTISLNSRPFTVVGVLRPDFQFAPTANAEIWVPLYPNQTQMSRRYQHWLKVIGRVKEGVTFEQAQAEVSAVGSRIEQLDPQWHGGAGLKIVSLNDQITGSVKPLLIALLGAVAFVLLIACANVANLLLVSASGRTKEIAIRMALGASRGRIARQLMVESLLLAALGGTAALVLAEWGVDLLVAAIPRDQLAAMPYLEALAIDGRVLGFTFLLTLATGIVFGLAPALQASKADLQTALKEGGKTSAMGGRARLRSLFVAAEVAFAIVLLVGAGLMIKSLARLMYVDAGFNTKNLLTFQLALPFNEYQHEHQVIAFHKQLLDRIDKLPGVEGSATVSLLPLTGGGDTGSVHVEGRPAPVRDDGSESNLRTVSAAYFSVMGIPLIRGRLPTERDDRSGARVVVINQTLAERLFAGEDPVGRNILFAFLTENPGWQIIGVVGDEKVTTLDGVTTPVVYFPFLQDASQMMSVVVRAAGDPASLVAAVRGEVRALDPLLPVYSEMTMEELINNSPSTFLRRYPALLIGVFAAIAIALAATGIYGVVSYSVSQRTHEIGIRLALGAAPRDIMRLIARSGLRLALAGMAVGLAASLILTRLLSSLLFGVEATDAMTYLIVSLLLIGVALGACFIPARRAARLDPMEALRRE